MRKSFMIGKVKIVKSVKRKYPTN